MLVIQMNIIERIKIFMIFTQFYGARHNQEQQRLQKYIWPFDLQQYIK